MKDNSKQYIEKMNLEFGKPWLGQMFLAIIQQLIRNDIGNSLIISFFYLSFSLCVS
jgi:hypothetical protein